MYCIIVGLSYQRQRYILFRCGQRHRNWTLMPLLSFFLDVYWLLYPIRARPIRVRKASIVSKVDISNVTKKNIQGAILTPILSIKSVWKYRNISMNC